MIGQYLNFMIEARVEKKLVGMVRKLGGRALKFESPGTAGVPDRIVLMPHGKIYFVELKAPGEKPRPLQVAIHEEFKALGFEVEVIDTTEGVEAFAKRLDEEQQEQHGI